MKSVRSQRDGINILQVSHMPLSLITSFSFPLSISLLSHTRSFDLLCHTRILTPPYDIYLTFYCHLSLSFLTAFQSYRALNFLSPLILFDLTFHDTLFCLFSTPLVPPPSSFSFQTV